MVHPSRIHDHSGGSLPVSGRYVLYWMQASQRARCNHALEVAIAEAGRLGVPTVVAFGLTGQYPEAQPRHYRFMLQGLAETAQDLRERGVAFCLRLGEPPEVALELAAEARLVVMDAGYLRHQRAWRTKVTRGAPCPVLEVESDVVIPARVASDKEEYAARTLRPKIHRLLGAHLRSLEPSPVHVFAGDMGVATEDASDVEGLLSALNLTGDVDTTPHCLVGGTSQAVERLEGFVTRRLPHYHDRRSDPAEEWTSGLSPYLHFGQIAPLEVALAAQEAGGQGAEDLLEELIVRRELSINFVLHNPAYDRYECLPEWARATLGKHSEDIRDPIYTAEELEQAATADPYWNAAQREIRLTGAMHNYMRMYWGKKILEWTRTPEEAFAITLALNNRYCLDGRDPNSYAGVAWCYGKHDRPWQERAVFGTVRSMTRGGLDRKFNMAAYTERVEAL